VSGSRIAIVSVDFNVRPKKLEAPMPGKFLLCFVIIIVIPLVGSAGEFAELELSAKRLFSYKWVHHQRPHGAAEVITWEFFKDGSFRRSFTSDYLERYAGAWALSEASQDRGILFLASTADDQARPLRFNVLSFEFLEGGLRLGESLYQAVSFSDRDVAPRISKRDQAALIPNERERFFGLWEAMTVVNWEAASAPPPGDPSAYSFSRDGRYTARFATTRCQYSGTWSLLTSGGNTGQVRFSVPANHCDPRGLRETYIREMPVTSKDDGLVLYRTPYEPRPKEAVK
jgi:hypothetical protein